jgi:hypothetical protein
VQPCEVLTGVADGDHLWCLGPDARAVRLVVIGPMACCQYSRPTLLAAADEVLDGPRWLASHRDGGASESRLR